MMKNFTEVLDHSRHRVEGIKYTKKELLVSHVDSLCLYCSIQQIELINTYDLQIIVLATK